MKARFRKLEYSVDLLRRSTETIAPWKYTVAVVAVVVAVAVAVVGGRR